MDVARAGRLVGHMHRAQAHLVRGAQVARIILEHGCAGRVQTVSAKDHLIGRAFGFWQKVCMFNAIDRIKQARQPARGQHLFGIGRAGIGVDDAPARQGRHGAGQIGVGGQDAEVDVVDLRQIGSGVHVMFAHQTRQRGAIGVPIVLAQPVRLGAAKAQRLHHPVGHAHLDLVEQAVARRVKRVVEVKDPGGDMGKGLFHGGTLARPTGCGNATLPGLRVVGATAGG